MYARGTLFYRSFYMDLFHQGSHKLISPYTIGAYSIGSRFYGDLFYKDLFYRVDSKRIYSKRIHSIGALSYKDQFYLSYKDLVYRHCIL